MKWFRVYGRDVLNDEKLMGLDSRDLGLWLKFMCIASIQDPPGKVSSETLAKVWRINGRTLAKLRRTFCETLAMLRETSAGFEVVNWHKYQSDYELYQKGKGKTSKERESDLVKSEEPDTDTDTEVDTSKNTVVINGSKGNDKPQRKDPERCAKLSQVLKPYEGLDRLFLKNPKEVLLLGQRLKAFAPGTVALAFVLEGFTDKKKPSNWIYGALSKPSNKIGDPKQKYLDDAKKLQGSQ